ncbi:MAG TPA: transketolase C-terminal domain-containing protein [Limnochordia bacterium]|nr:transketolase C-terminal domain-containing protein [Limnochordia bacterium]
MADVRDAFIKTLIDEAREDERIVTVVNDSVGSSKLRPFLSEFPDRVFNVGIAEQNMVGVGAGLAAAGLLPWVSSATCFLSYRALEQIKNDVVYPKHNVRLVGNTTGVDYGALGATHHALEDLGTLRALPGLTVVTPSDMEEAEAATRALMQHEGPAYLRLYRASVPEKLDAPGSFELGKVRVLRNGDDCTIFACGPMVVRALDAARMLEADGYSAGVVAVSTLAPLDVAGVLEASAGSRCVVTVEEHMTVGGLGSAICEILAEHDPKHVLRLGISGGFAVPGPAEAVREYYGLTAAGIRERVAEFVRRVTK